jgi:hypothetical protein
VQLPATLADADRIPVTAVAEEPLVEIRELADVEQSQPEVEVLTRVEILPVTADAPHRIRSQQNRGMEERCTRTVE